jgi:hypothetical protein
LAAAIQTERQRQKETQELRPTIKTERKKERKGKNWLGFPARTASDLKQRKKKGACVWGIKTFNRKSHTQKHTNVKKMSVNKGVQERDKPFKGPSSPSTLEGKMLGSSPNSLSSLLISLMPFWNSSRFPASKSASN